MPSRSPGVLRVYQDARQDFPARGSPLNSRDNLQDSYWHISPWNKLFQCIEVYKHCASARGSHESVFPHDLEDLPVLEFPVEF